MSRRLAAAALSTALGLAGCSTPGPTTTLPKVIPTQNASFDQPARPGERCAIHWGCSAHANPDSFRFFHEEGARGYCIQSVTSEPWSRMTQGLLKETAIPLRGARVRYTVWVKLDEVTAGKAGPVIAAQSGSGRRLDNVMNLKPREQGVQRIEVEATVPAETFVLEVGVVFEGKGKVCIEDSRLEMTAAPPGPV
jgi:hypothetical protein